MASGFIAPLQKGANPLDSLGRGSRPSAQIEHEARIADRIPAEAGRRSLAPIQELLDFTK